jgi:hypothetical protein
VVQVIKLSCLQSTNDGDSIIHEEEGLQGPKGTISGQTMHLTEVKIPWPYSEQGIDVEFKAEKFDE